MRHSVSVYGLTLIAVIAAGILRWLLAPVLGNANFYFTFLSAVVFAAWIGGWRPAALASIGGLLVAWYFFIPPQMTFYGTSASSLIGMAIYLMICALFTLFGEAMRHAKEQSRSQANLLRVTLASIGDAVITTDAKGSINFLNEVAQDLTGWTQDLAAGKELSEVFHTIDEVTRQPVENPADRALKDEAAIRHPVRTLLISRDGTQRPIDDSAAPIRDESGTIIGAVLVSRDVTGRRQRERDLENREREFRSLAESIPQLVWIANPDGDLIWYNQRWYDYTGTTFEQMQGWGWQSLHDPEYLPKVLEKWKSSLQTGDPFDMVFPIKGRDGHFRSFLTRIEPVKDEAGRVVRWFGTNTDISDRMRNEQEMKEARSRLESTLAAGEIGTWEFDVGNNIVRADPNLTRMFGIASEEATAGPVEAFINLIHADDRDRLIKSVEHAIESGESFELEYRVVTPDQGVRWVVARGRVERDDQGRSVRLPGVVVDITQRKAIEEKLKKTEVQRNLALDSAELGLWNIDPRTNTLLCDQRFRIIFSGEVGPLDYERAFDLIHPEDRDRVRDAVSAAVQPENPAPYAEEYRVVHPKTQVVRWVLAKGRANFETHGDDQRLVSFDGTVVDITERKQMENDLRQLAANLSAADHRKDEFLATLAHELRNPLAPIRNGLQIMKHAKDDEAVEQLRAMMERQLSQVVRLVDDLMDVSRINKGKLELRKEQIELAAILSSAIETCRPLMEEMRHELIVNLPQQPVRMHADPTRLSQVFMNLLNNAAKYSDKGGQIRLTAEIIDDQVVVTVQDSGVGIPTDKLTSIFEMFSQVDGSLERAQGGLGIGLTLVKRLVEMHDGRIEARSRGRGTGSEFIVQLPAAIEHTSPPVGHQNHSAVSSSSFRVLIVDDNRDGADSLAMLLRIGGNTTRTAYDGQQGVKVAENFRPNLVLLDIGLPKMNGYEACRHIREQAWGKNIIMIALTGWGQDADRRRSEEAGFNHHLVKPVDTVELMKLLAGFHVVEA